MEKFRIKAFELDEKGREVCLFIRYAGEIDEARRMISDFRIDANHDELAPHTFFQIVK